MQTAAFMARCPFEIGDKLRVGMVDKTLIVNYPNKDLTAEVVITDILTIHSLKNQCVEFRYEIYGVEGRLWKVADWKEVSQDDKT